MLDGKSHREGMMIFSGVRPDLVSRDPSTLGAGQPVVMVVRCSELQSSSKWPAG